MKRPFAVIRTRGSAWNDSIPLQEQADWAAHADFMDGLAEEGFVLLAGPFEGSRDVLIIVRAESAEEIDERLAADPWTKSGLLVTQGRWPWKLRLGSLA